MIIRTALEDDFPSAVGLYAEFGNRVPPIRGEEGRDQWKTLLEHPGTTVVVAEVAGQIVAMVTLHILPNMTYAGRPYALIEHVIATEEFRGQGVAKQVMERVIETAWEADAYKIMLLTGKKGEAKGFYENLGFSDDDKYGMTLRKVAARYA